MPTANLLLRDRSLTIYSASSILQKNTMLYGPSNMLDTESTSSWNSEGVPDGADQWILLNFGRTVTISKVELQVQAGFSAECGSLQIKNESGDWEDAIDLEIDDVHDIQGFDVPMLKCSALRLTLSEFTDFYGRVIIYQLRVWGEES